MLDARARSADDGELGSHEETVGQDEEEDDRDRDQDLHYGASSDGTGTTRLAATDCRDPIRHPLDFEFEVTDDDGLALGRNVS